VEARRKKRRRRSRTAAASWRREPPSTLPSSTRRPPDSSSSWISSTGPIIQPPRLNLGILNFFFTVKYIMSECSDEGKMRAQNVLNLKRSGSAYLLLGAVMGPFFEVQVGG
jgi:hypothetical protein